MQKIRLYKSVPLHILTALLCLTVMAFIFYMSGRVRDDSNTISKGFLYRLLFLFPSFRQKSAEMQTETVFLWNHFARKTAHFLIFGALGFFAFLFFAGFSAPLPVHFGRAWGTAILYAVSDEIHQSFVPGRGPGLGDILLDSAGALCGTLTALLLALLILHSRRRKEACSVFSRDGKG